MSTQDRAPAFPFYAKDWLADPKVRAMTPAERGNYIDLLASMWEHADAGCEIPRNTAERLYGKAFIRMLADGAASVLFAYEKDGIDWLYSDRLSQEAQKLKSRSESARKSADARWDAVRNRCVSDANA